MIAVLLWMIVLAAELLLGRVADLQTLGLTKLLLEFGNDTHLAVAVDLHRDLHLRTICLLHRLTSSLHGVLDILHIQEVIVELNQILRTATGVTWLTDQYGGDERLVLELGNLVSTWGVNLYDWSILTHVGNAHEEEQD